MSKSLLFCVAVACFCSATVLAGPTLTPEEQIIISDAITLIAADLEKHSIGLFMGLFKEAPEYQQLFAGFKDTPYDDLPNDPKLKAHSMNIVGAFAKTVTSNLKDGDAMENAFKDIAGFHIAKKVGVQHVQVLKRVFINYLTEKAAYEMTPERTEAWNKVFENAMLAFEKVTNTKRRDDL